MSEVSLGVYPPIIRVKSNPGADVNVPITVLNNSEDSINVELSLKPFYDSGKMDGSVLYYAEKDIPQKDLDFLNQVKVKDKDTDIKRINIYPKEYKTLNLNFKTPKDISSDYYFSVIFSKAVEKTLSDETKSYIKPGVAINVLVSKNQSMQSLQIYDLDTDQIQLSGPARITLIVKNNSDHYGTFSGEMVLFDIFGKAVERTELNREIILGRSSKSFTGKGKENKIELGDKFMFGLYTVRAEIKYEGKNIVSKETKFFATPLTFLMIIIIVLFIALSIIIKVLKRLNVRR